MSYVTGSRLTLTALVKNLAKHDTSWDDNINSKAMGQDESKEHEIEEHFSRLSQKKGRTKLPKKFN